MRTEFSAAEWLVLTLVMLLLSFLLGALVVRNKFDPDDRKPEKTVRDKRSAGPFGE
ncbi:MAG: hypothetical protein LUD68_04480 [Rikenellaceae bacterium]|nr:hypothetical protein [Rikenellaceae bacterium]